MAKWLRRRIANPRSPVRVRVPPPSWTLHPGAAYRRGSDLGWGHEPRRALGEVQRTLVQAALTYPESHEDHPRDHVAIKVRGKMFLVLGGTR